jgi:murein DD-endopeptidase MepM/ murein hydrolase activator NlpD
MRNDAKLVVIPAGKSSVREFRLNYNKVAFYIATTIVFLVVALSATVNLLTEYVNDSRLHDLSRSNAVLKEHILQLNQRIDSLYANMSGIQAQDDDIRLLMNLPDVDPDIRTAGVGGAIADVDLGKDLAGFFLDDDSKSSLLSVYEKMQQLERQVQFELQSYATLATLVRAKKDSLRYLPAIFPCEGHRLTDGFGVRRHPITGRRTKHEGLDIAAKIGNPVYATADGVVRFVGRNGGYGKSIFIDHKYGYQTRFAHLNAYNVRRGQYVKRGDVIGEVGNTGRSTGPHLHYEIRLNDQAVDPMGYFFDNRFLK